MKTTGLFTNCIITKDGPFFCGETKEGVQIYANAHDIARGFKLFTHYTVAIDESSQKDIPFYGSHVSASIIRMGMIQMPEWLRFERVVEFLARIAHPEKKLITATEGIVSVTRAKSATHHFPSVSSI